MLTEAILAIIVGVLIWAYQVLKTPCASKSGLSRTSPTIRLNDGRCLAYKLRGAAKESAKYKVIMSHGFCDSKDMHVPLSDEWLCKHDICLLIFDRPGYAESDPNPNRSPKNDANDIQELVDQLGLGPKIYVIGLSIGTYPCWGCLEYIPHRLAGMALVVPAMNYWWPSLPPEQCSLAFSNLELAEQWRLCILHYAPKLAWMLRKVLPMPTVDSILKKNPRVFNDSDLELWKWVSNLPAPHKDNKGKQHDEYESLHRDMELTYGKWEFNPLDVDNPFPDDEGQVHIWIGQQDWFVSPELQRHIAERLPWVRFHEVPEAGHLIIYDVAICEMIFKSLVLGEEPS